MLVASPRAWGALGHGVAIDEHLGAKLPLDARFRTQTGAHVTLGEIVKGDLPTILTFNYSDCPMLCSLQLNGLSAALPKIAVPPAPFKSFAIADPANSTVARPTALHIIDFFIRMPLL